VPGCVPLFLEVQACHVANYRYFHDWQELEEEQKAFLIGHFVTGRWVSNHQADAEYRAQEAAAKKKK